ncbi:hypothetical protein IJ765_00950 [Candidatus Saccharibacteria bacterium]|nr:hypothetical protein [Candidatus Saccharibacteria bacterium]
MAKQTRLFAALTLAFGAFPTHLAIATSVAPIPEVSDLSETITNTENIEAEIPPDELEVPPDSSDDPELQPVEIPPLYIKALSPGYTVDKASNTGEFIEIVNSTTSLVSLEGIALWYNNGTKDYLVYEFPEYSFLAPGSLVLRLKSSPEVRNAEDSLDVANAVYAKDLAMSGSLRLVATAPVDDSSSEAATAASDAVVGEVSEDVASAEETILDSICWTGKAECIPSFTSANPHILARDAETFEPVQLETYEPDFNAEALQIIMPESVAGETDLTVDGSTGAGDISGDDSAGSTPDSGGSPTPVNSGVGVDVTISTLAPCPEGKYRNPETNRCKNIEVEPEEKTCAEGYYLNPSTNRCKKVEVEAEPKACGDGYYLNPATNRCNKLPTEKELTPCKDGYERNPETNRCRKIADDTEDELTPCAEGYERNPETNRCRKIKVNDGADYALVPTTGGVEQKNFTALWAIGGVVLIGVGVVIFQFRHELAHFLKSLGSRLSRKH